MARKTSRQTYQQIVKEGLLPKCRMESYKFVYKHGPCTANQVEIGLEDRNAHKRLSELRDAGVLYEVKQDKCPITGRLAIFWNVTGALPRVRKVGKEIVKRSSNKGKIVRTGVSIVVSKYIEGTTPGVLLGLRKGSHGSGLWAMPGGAVEPGEDPEMTASRELEEEVGILADPTALRMIKHANITVIDGDFWVTLFYAINVAKKVEPVLKEPDKCAEWNFFANTRLPRDLFPPTAVYARAHNWRTR